MNQLKTTRVGMIDNKLDDTHAITVCAGVWNHYFRDKETFERLADDCRICIDEDDTEVSVRLPEELIGRPNVESIWKRMR